MTVNTVVFTPRRVDGHLVIKLTLPEQTLEEQGYQMGDGKTAVKDVIKSITH